MIKNIIFDLGNVLLDLDYLAARNAFRALFGADWDFEKGAAHVSNRVKHLPLIVATL